MSRVQYQFATTNQLGWTHSIMCDYCRRVVERPGDLPKHTNDGPAEFAPGALVGWSSFEMKTAEVALNRDFCPSCAKVVHDFLCSMGCQIGTVEARFLDALGRKTGGNNPALGTRLCGEQIGATRLCFRPVGHEGAHGPLEEGQQFCSVCFAQREVPVLSYTQAQLESHAVDVHEIQHQDTLSGLRPAGWVSSRENPRVAYSTVQAALLAERQLLRNAPPQIGEAALARRELEQRLGAALSGLQEHGVSPETIEALRLALLRLVS